MPSHHTIREHLDQSSTKLSHLCLTGIERRSQLSYLQGHLSNALAGVLTGYRGTYRSTCKGCGGSCRPAVGIASLDWYRRWVQTVVQVVMQAAVQVVR